MKQVQDKEQWINEVMGSTDGIQRPAGNPFLYEKIKYKMERGSETVPVAGKKMAWGWAMALVALLAVNGVAIVNKIAHEKKAQAAAAINSLVPEMSTQTIYSY
ncbi:MAG: hypothetical protein JSS82_12945 [Bacteroidetes bacterium]|nr:hypothetical protein [Bacteroidota bacterium]